MTAIERAGEVRLSMLAAAVTNKTIEPTTVTNIFDFEWAFNHILYYVCLS